MILLAKKSTNSSPWETVSFRDLLKAPLRNGVSPSSTGTFEMPVLTLSAVTGASFDAEAIKIGQFDREIPLEKRVDAEDFLICRGNGNKNLVGKGRFPKQGMQNTAFPDTIIAGRIKNDKIDRIFLEQYWNSNEARIQIESSARTTSGIFKINQKSIEEMKIPLPPLHEQRRIAAILSEADRLRQKRLDAIENLKTLTASLLEKFIRRASEVLSTQLLSDIICNFRYGTSARSAISGYPVLRIPNIIGGSIDCTELKTVPLAEREANRLRLQYGDLLFVRTNGNPEYVGRSAVVTESLERNTPHQMEDFVYASYLIRGRPIKSKVDPIFLQSYLSSPFGRKLFREKAKTSAGQFNINIEGLSSIEVSLPPLDVQRAFAARVAEIDKLKAVQRAHLAKLDELFASLQHRAFRGEL